MTGAAGAAVTAQQPYFGLDRAAVREIFADHDLIEGLGCGSIINVPVIADGRTLGVLDILDAEGTYDDNAVVVVESLAPPAVSALLDLEKENRDRIPAAAQRPTARPAVRRVHRRRPAV